MTSHISAPPRPDDATHDPVAPPDRRRRRTRVRPPVWVGAHAPLLAVLALGVAVRVGAAIAYWPGLLYRDSWHYVQIALERFPVGFGFARPSGYPLVLRALWLGGRDPGIVLVAQEVAGLATGVLAYALLARLGARRWVATLAAALVVLDGHAVALEVDLLAEAFTALALLASFFLLLGGRRRWWAVALSGLLLAAAALLRLEALFAVPAWLLGVAWDTSWPRRVAVGVPALALPLVAYLALHAAGTGTFAFTEADGWLLYGRVAQIADCRGADIAPAARPLCQSAAARARPEPRTLGPIYYLFRPGAPAPRLFGRFEPANAAGGRPNRILGQFAWAIVAHHPLRYAGLVGGELVRYFDPAVPDGAAGHADLPTRLPGPTFISNLAAQNRLAEPDRAIRARWLARYRPRFGATGALMNAYGRYVHLSRWATDALFALAAVALALAAARRVAIPRRREVAVLAGATLLMLAGSVASSLFTLRYLMPALPLLICAGLLAFEDLRAVMARWRRSRGRRQPGVGAPAAARIAGSASDRG